MLENGLYDLRFQPVAETHGDSGNALAIVRNGKILGSDPWGGVFAGSCEFDAQARTTNVRVCFDIPPEGQLITGFSAGPEGATLDIVGAFKQATPETVVNVAGAEVKLHLTYLGPLPC